MSDEVLAKLGRIEGSVSELQSEVSRIHGKVDVLQGMVTKPDVEIETTVSRSTNKRNAAIGAAIVKWVGSGGFIAAVASYGGTQIHEYQREQTQAEAVQRAHELEQLKRQLIAEQKRVINESTNRQTEELEASRDSRDSARDRSADVSRNRGERSNR